uniref:Uncharacterized protein n=1 Tax=Strigamia maritima TaxID=126957 RepID=T1JAE8_STRMM
MMYLSQKQKFEVKTNNNDSIFINCYSSRGSSKQQISGRLISDLCPMFICMIKKRREERSRPRLRLIG